MIVLAPDAPDDAFPPVANASPEGIVAIGGDLSTSRLVAAYRRGIFPWYNEQQPILWWSPDPRTVIYPDNLIVRRSLAKRLRNAGFEVSLDQNFNDVLEACRGPRRGHEPGETWITDEMAMAYNNLHSAGFAHSVEVKFDDRLVGGLYGVSCGSMFFGESMFSLMPDASKVALVWLVRQLALWDFAAVDCQLPSDHVFRMGATEISRSQFINELNAALLNPDRTGSWAFEYEKLHE